MQESRSSNTGGAVVELRSGDANATNHGLGNRPLVRPVLKRQHLFSLEETLRGLFIEQIQYMEYFYMNQVTIFPIQC
jgi:hypothetical protein